MKYLTPADVSESLSVPVKTVYRWISERQIESVKVGRLVRISQAELDRMISDNTRPAVGARRR